MERSGAVYARLLRKVVSDKMIDKLEEFAKLLKEKIEKRKTKNKRNYEKIILFTCPHDANDGKCR